MIIRSENIAINHHNIGNNTFTKKKRKLLFNTSTLFSPYFSTISLYASFFHSESKLEKIFIIIYNIIKKL